MPTFEERFRGVANWCSTNGFAAGYPTCHENTSATPTKYGTIIVTQGVNGQDVPRTTLGNPNTPRTRLTSAHDWSKTQGAADAFPNFHEANYGQGVVYGTMLLAPSAVTWQDVPVVNILGNNIDPTSRQMEEWFKGTHDWAVLNGRTGAIPNGHYANYNGTWVIGVFSFNPGFAQWRELTGAELGFPTQYTVGPGW
jgi:hypothetical protein